MIFWRIWKLGGLLAALVFLATSASGETWHLAETDNFIVYSSGDMESARDNAILLERFDKLLRLRYRIPLTPSPNRLTVYLLDG